MLSRAWRLSAIPLTLAAAGGVLAVTAGAEGPSSDGQLVLDQSNPLGALSGTLPDGRTYGPMPMAISPVDTPEEAKEFEEAMPDLIPVISADGQNIAGYADRVALQTQRSDSSPVEVYGVDFVTVVGYWHFQGGFSATKESPESVGNGPDTSEAKP